MGCNHPDPGCSGSSTSLLGSRWIAGLGGTRIVPPIAYPVRDSGRACMKRRRLLLKPFVTRQKGEDRPFGRSFSVGRIFVRSCSLTFQNISNFSQ